MAYSIPNFKVGFWPADIDMSDAATYQYTAVWLGAAANGKGAANGLASLQTKGSKTTAPIGVLQNNPVQGEAGELILEGITYGKAGGTFAVGADLTVNSSGQFIAATAGTIIVGMALEAAVSGNVCSVYLRSVATIPSA